MKKNIWRKAGAVGSVAFACAGVSLAVLVAGNASRQPVSTETSLEILTRVSAPEMPAVAARLVSESAVDARAAKATEVILAVNALSRSSTLPFVVSAISQAAPETAATVVAKASELQPEVSMECVRAAVVATPKQTESIVAKVCQQQPQSYAQVAMVAAAEMPQRTVEIYRGVTTALPQLQPLVERATASQGSAQDVAAVMGQVNNMVVSAAREEVAAAKQQVVTETTSPSVTQTPAAVVPPATPVVAASVTPPSQAVTPEPAVYTPLVSNPAQRGPPVITPITPPAIPPAPTPITIADTAVNNTGTGRNYSAP